MFRIRKSMSTILQHTSQPWTIVGNRIRAARRFERIPTLSPPSWRMFSDKSQRKTLPVTTTTTTITAITPNSTEYNAIHDKHVSFPDIPSSNILRFSLSLSNPLPPFKFFFIHSFSLSLSLFALQFLLRFSSQKQKQKQKHTRKKKLN